MRSPLSHDAGATVTVHLYREPREIERTIVAIGSHDLTLDLMAQFHEAGKRPSPGTAGELLEQVALYNPVPAGEEEGYRVALSRAYADYCGALETIR